MKKDGTRNFYRTELEMMSERPSKKAMEIGKRPPYYLQANKESSVKKITEIEAIEKIREQICNEKGVQRYCRDNCMHGTEYCAYSMAIKALEKQIPKKANNVERKRDEYGFIYQMGECPCCGKCVTDDRQCCDCGQKLDWE